ncbi:MAG: PEP-CTERM sorting domain-containing protein [Myxococcota bacterium]
MSNRSLVYPLIGLLALASTLILLVPGTALATSMIFEWETGDPPRYPWLPTPTEEGSVLRRAAADYSGYCPGCGLDGEDEYYNAYDRETSPLVFGTWSATARSNGVTAYHESTITDQRADFHATADSGYGDHQADSGLTIMFRVDEAATWRLEGDSASASVRAIFSADGEEIHNAYGARPYIREEARLGDPYSFYLLPDIDYELFLGISSFSGSQTEGSISWSVVPEPGTAVLFGFGLGLLGARRRLPSS